MLTGLRKRGGEARALEELQARIKTGLPGVRSIDATIPETVEQITSKCLELDPANRYQTSADLVADLGGSTTTASSFPKLGG